jgi:hypothetical protein
MRRYTVAVLLLAACGGEDKPEAAPRATQMSAEPMAALETQDTVKDNGYVIVITSQGIVDTTWEVLSVDTIMRPDVGVPIGRATREGEVEIAGISWASVSTGTPKALFENLQWARRSKLKAITFNLPGGGHNANQCEPLPSKDCGPNLSRINGIPRYDSTKYLARVKAFDNNAVRDSVKKYCKPTGAIWCEINAYDEPHVTGGWDGASMTDGNTWGDKGWMTKAKVDRGCQALKQAFRNLIPAGPAGAPTLFYPEQPAYKVCDFIRAQYSWRMSRVKNANGVYVSPSGGREKWWNDQVQAAKGLPVTPSINIVNGGVQDIDGTWDCKASREGGVKGSRTPNCSMLPDSVKAYLLYFGSRAFGSHMMWREDPNREVRLYSVYKTVADSLNKVQYKPIPVR